MFTDIQYEVEKRLQELAEYTLFEVDLEKNKLFDTYLNALPEDRRQEHNCSCCKHFLRDFGGIIAVVDSRMLTLWDFEMTGTFHKVPVELGKIIRAAKIKGMFMSETRTLGTESNVQDLGKGHTKRWNHFDGLLPKSFSVTARGNISSNRSDVNSLLQVFERSLNEITVKACETVLELISQGSLYRGNEFMPMIEKFLGHKLRYSKLNRFTKKLYVYENIKGAFRMRNTAIGTILVNLSEGMPIDIAVNKFEAVVAPANYKRPKPLITPKMLEAARVKLSELGLLNSLERRHANIDDIPVSEVLFTDRTIEKPTDLFESIAYNIKPEAKHFDKVAEVHIDTFIQDILPTLTSIEVLFEAKHSGNLMNIIAPVDPTAQSLFNWASGLSWTYFAGLTDTVKERVKKAGGTTKGELRFTLDWFNTDDLDISVLTPGGSTIYYGSRTADGGKLDVDMNVTSSEASREAVENIIFKQDLLEGDYKVYVHNYCLRETTDVGFNIQIECRDKLLKFAYDDSRVRREVQVAKVHYSKTEGVTLLASVVPPSEGASKLVMWGIPVGFFRRVKTVMLSPNHWGANCSGNKHTFFVIEDAVNDKPVRGFFNEFLKGELLEHKRVFEVLGNKVEVEQSNHQLAGLGFSSTQRNEIICKVNGSFERVIKILF